MSKKKQIFFRESWLSNTNYKCVVTTPSNIEAKYKLCKKIIQLSNMGEEALISHSKGDGDKRRVKDAVEVQSFFAKSGIKKSRAKMADSSVQSSTSTSASQSCDNSVSDANQSTSSASCEKD